METKAWAIIDITKKKPRFCYSGDTESENYKENVVAIFFKRPKIAHNWKYAKKVVRVAIKADI